MASLPMLTAREVIRALERAGFQVQRQTGSHARLKHADNLASVVFRRLPCNASSIFWGLALERPNWMSDIAIRVEHLSKLYTIGARQERHDTTSTLLSASLRDAMAGRMAK